MSKEQIKKSLDNFFEKNNLPSEESMKRMLNYKNQKQKKDRILKPSYFFGMITTLVTLSCIVFVLTVVKPTESNKDVNSNLSESQHSEILKEFNLEKVHIEPLDNTFFNVLVYQMQYFQSAFWTEAEAKSFSFDSLVGQTALMTFAQSKGIKVDEKEIQKLAKQKNTEFLQKLSQEKTAIEYGELFKALGISEKEYYNEVINFNAKYELLESKLLNELSIKTKNSKEYKELYLNAINFYKEVATDEINSFKEEFQINEHQLTENKLKPLKEPVEVTFDYKNVSALALGENSDGELEFKKPHDTWNYILEEYADILYKVEQDNDMVIPFGPLTYNEYKTSLENFVTETPNEYQTKAKQLIEILNIFEHSYNEDYRFE